MKKSELKAIIKEVFNEVKGAFDVPGTSEYKVAQNPTDKKWYVMGKVGKYYMPVSNAMKSKDDAMKWAKKQPDIDKKERGM